MSWPTDFTPIWRHDANIIVAIYKENINEIIVIGMKDDQEGFRGIEKSLHEIDKSGELTEKIKTLNYLFQYCHPEFQKGNVRDWLQGHKNLSDNIRKSVNTISKHPLVPEHVEVKGMFLNREKILELDVS